MGHTTCAQRLAATPEFARWIVVVICAVLAAFTAPNRREGGMIPGVVLDNAFPAMLTVLLVAFPGLVWGIRVWVAPSVLVATAVVGVGAVQMLGFTPGPESSVYLPVGYVWWLFLTPKITVVLSTLVLPFVDGLSVRNCPWLLRVVCVLLFPIAIFGAFFAIAGMMAWFGVGIVDLWLTPHIGVLLGYLMAVGLVVGLRATTSE